MPECRFSYLNLIKKIGHTCAVKWDENYEKIEAWTTDTESDLYNEWNVRDGCDWDWLYLYYTKDEILKMQKSMTYNKTLLEELLENNNLDGLIVIIN